MATNAQQSGGVGFLGLLALLFIGLKLAGQIGWSWWWVLSPLWAPFAIAFGILALGIAFGLLVRLWHWSMRLWK
jgi:hypothetical protein